MSRALQGYDPTTFQTRPNQRSLLGSRKQVCGHKAIEGFERLLFGRREPIVVFALGGGMSLFKREESGPDVYRHRGDAIDRRSPAVSGVSIKRFRLPCRYSSRKDRSFVYGNDETNQNCPAFSFCVDQIADPDVLKCLCSGQFRLLRV